MMVLVPHILEQVREIIVEEKPGTIEALVEVIMCEILLLINHFYSVELLVIRMRTKPYLWYNPIYQKSLVKTVLLHLLLRFEYI